MTFAFLGFLVVQLQGIAIGGVPSTNIAGVVLAENEAQAERNPTTRLILGIPQTATFSKYILMQLYVDALVGSRVQPQDHSQEGHCAEVENTEKGRVIRVIQEPRGGQQASLKGSPTR